VTIALAISNRAMVNLSQVNLTTELGHGAVTIKSAAPFAVAAAVGATRSAQKGAQGWGERSSSRPERQLGHFYSIFGSINH
jgi:hypothetical protein